MRNKDELKRQISAAIDKRRSDIEKIGDHIMVNPELGFKEFKTAKLVSETMEGFGIPHDRPGIRVTDHNRTRRKIASGNLNLSKLNADIIYQLELLEI